VWLPIATDSAWQQVRCIRISVPGDPRETVEQQYGNHLLYFEATADEAGEIPLEIVYDIRRKETVSSPITAEGRPLLGLFLKPSRNIPVDGSLMRQVVTRSILGTDAMASARAFYDAVDGHMRYNKPAGQPWGRGDAVWACQSGFGNCTDYHSLFIGLCRERQIPAKFEIGFPIAREASKGTVEGYHCWAMFAADGRWHAVDISEADQVPEMKEYYFGRLTPDRVTFTLGRDLQLEPRQAAGPVNFLIYPYVEVDGKPHTSLEKRFRYEEID
jgi:transglutaminase-like putative cysteine protease